MLNLDKLVTFATYLHDYSYHLTLREPYDLFAKLYSFLTDDPLIIKG